MRALITTLPGDGIGPEVTHHATRALRAVADRFEHDFQITEALIGGAAVDATGSPLPTETRDACRSSDAIFLGAVGGSRWSDTPPDQRPEAGLLALRRELNVFANLRPIEAHPAAAAHSPIRPDRLDGVDMLFVRELTGGIYFGGKHRSATEASDTCTYTTAEIERVTRIACRLARGRRARVTSVDKANVLDTSRLWRDTVDRIVRDEFPEIQLEHLLVDAAAMHILNRPADFDVILTENMFGDILTDEAALLVGSLGMIPSASLSDTGPGLFEPIHGSAPDLAGTNRANPIGAILSAAMLLRHGLGLRDEAEAIDTATRAALDDGIRTHDLCPDNPASTDRVADAIIDRIACERPINA